MAQVDTTGGTPVTPVNFFSKISWSAILAGVVVALISQLLLSLLGIGIGMAAMNPMEENVQFSNLGVGAIIWWIVTILISLFLGGWVAGRWGGSITSTGRVFHGVLVWCVFTLFSFYLTTTAIGRVIGGVGGMMGQVFTITAPQVAQRVDKQDLQQIAQEAMQMNRSGSDSLMAERSTTTGGTTGGDAQQYSNEELMQAIEKMQKNNTPQNREEVANMLAARTGMSQAEARQNVDKWATRLSPSNIQQQGQEVAEGITTAAWIAFFALVIGAGVAAWGGGVGGRAADRRVVDVR